MNTILSSLSFAARTARKALTAIALVISLQSNFAAPAASDDSASVIIVTGAGGASEYETAFRQWAERWKTASETGGARATVIGADPSETDSRDRLQKALAAERPDGPAELWLVLLGHGTSDGREAKFNLRGDDVTPVELAAWLKPIHRPMAIVAGFSGSGAFLASLAAPGRVVVTATRSGGEDNFARFGKFVSEAIADPEADTDKDGQVSLLEAWLTAAQRVAEFYKSEGRLATEHSLLDDNGDGMGTPADWFQGLHAIKKANSKASVDGLRAHQFHLIRSPAEQVMPPAIRARRDALELELAKLRDRKAETPEDDYYSQLEKLLLELAKVYSAAPAAD